MTQKPKGRKVAAKQIAKQEEPTIAATIKKSFDDLAAQLKEAGYELVIRRPPAKELVSFDIGLMFTRVVNETGARIIHVYVDNDVQTVIDTMLEENEKIIVKCNWFSPDMVVVGVPENLPAEMTHEATGSPQSDDSSESVLE